MGKAIICDDVTIVSTRLLVIFFCCRMCHNLVGCRINKKTRYCRVCEREKCPDDFSNDTRIEQGITFACCLIPKK